MKICFLFVVWLLTWLSLISERCYVSLKNIVDLKCAKSVFQPVVTQCVRPQSSSSIVYLKNLLGELVD